MNGADLQTRLMIGRRLLLYLTIWPISEKMRNYDSWLVMRDECTCRPDQWLASPQPQFLIGQGSRMYQKTWPNERPTRNLDSSLARDEFIPDNLTNQGAEPGISRQSNLK